HRIRHHTVNSDRRQQQRNRGKRHQQTRLEQRLGGASRQEIFHGHHLFYRQVTIDTAHSIAQGRGQGLRRGAGANRKRNVVERKNPLHLRQRLVQGGIGALQVLLAYVIDHADDGEPILRLG